MNTEITSGAGTLTLGRLGFGAAGIGNLYRAIPDSRATATVEAAWDAGIRYFDTAPHYGLGLSERRLGSVLMGKPRQEFVLSTKVGRLLTPGSPDPASMFRDVPNEVPHFDFSLNSTQLTESLKIKPLLLEQGFDLIDQELVPQL